MLVIFYAHSECFMLQKLKDVQEFLRVPYRDLESRQVKIHTAPLSDQIENWDEVQKELTGTPFQWFLGKNNSNI